MVLMKRIGAACAVVASVVVPAACSGLPPGPAQHGSVSCSGGTLHLSVSPGVRFTHGRNTLTLTGREPEAPCEDDTGAGVTSASIESLSLSWEQLSCSGSSEMGSGPATVRWSDGSTSTAAVVASLNTAVTGQLSVFVIGGRCNGYQGTTEFGASPSAGDCASAVTAETVTIGSLVLRPAGA